MEGSVRTPWGRSDRLRDRRLPPGPGKQRDAVERNQRERLYGAVVAVVDEQGYEGMSVGAVAASAGVSRGTVYSYFGGRQECFLATFEALMEDGLTMVLNAYGEPGSWDEQLGRALDALLQMLAEQPAAARLCFLEAYAAGPGAAALRDRGATALEGIVRDAFDQSPERAGMPQLAIQGIVGGIRTTIQTNLRRRRADNLPELAPDLLAWVLGYQRPEPPLRQVTTTSHRASGFVATTHQERLFVALGQVVSENGYTATTVTDIVRTASVSLSTFYEHFTDKESAFLAACDFGIDQAFTSVRYSWTQAASDGWPAQVRAGIEELLSFLAAEPEWSYMAMVEIFAAGPRARARRDRTIELFTGLLEPGRALAPMVDSTTIEALGGAVYSLMYGQIRAHGAEHLPEILPAAVFVVLAPFVGNEHAAAVAQDRP